MKSIIPFLLVIAFSMLSAANAEVEVSGQVVAPKNVEHQESMTLSDAINQCGGQTLFAHMVFVYRETDKAIWVYTFNGRLLGMKEFGDFRLSDGDRVHIAQKQVYYNQPNIPKKFMERIDASELHCFRVDHTNLNKKPANKP